MDVGAPASRDSRSPFPEVDGAGRNCLLWEDMVGYPATAEERSGLSCRGCKAGGWGRVGSEGKSAAAARHLPGLSQREHLQGTDPLPRLSPA